MITKLISDNASRRTTKHYVFNKISNNRLILSLECAIHVMSRTGAAQCYYAKYKRFSRFTDTDTFANFVSESNLHKLTGLPFSSASSRIHDECSYENLSIDQSMDIF